ncbi:MAG: family 20 glycosylhydrolase [Acidobacteriota bacterium]|nr:family 20 glycosylhydrolase [Acidobacteriota bacterium]
MKKKYSWWGKVIFAILLTGASGYMPLSQAQTLNLMPAPANLQNASASLRVDTTFTVALTGHTDARLNGATERFLQQLAKRTGLPINPKSIVNPAGAGSRATLTIRTDHDSKPVQELGEDESYVLEVTGNGASITAPTDLGTLHALQTFLQLVNVTPDGFAAPAVKIQDKPRFAWRGLMIDSGRHFIPLEVLRRNIDGMEAVKMNVFHWHLSENQGFRIESKKFPKLHELGSDGLYYTQEEIRGLILYARERGIRVVPEFDIPGHSTAWFVGHPELASAPGPYKVERAWGIFDPAIDPSNEKVYKFLDQFIEEMTKLFPDHFFHVGGDEVNGKQWDVNPKIQEFIRAHGLKGNPGLQLYFNKRLQAIVSKHGKSMVGWDEILDPTLPKDIVIQSWRGQESLAEAARQGYRGILSKGYYLDLGWSAARHYAADPTGGEASNLSSQEKQRILGGESCMWSEYVDAENIDSRIWPRNAAIAERLWSPQEVQDPASMYTRLHAVSAQLEWLGLTHNSYYPRMLHRIAGPASTEEFNALKTFADVVEPVKDYTREQTATAPATSNSPLNRVVDAIPLESRAAREFSEMVDKFVGSSCRDAALAAELRAQLLVWRDNDAKLQPLMERSFLAKDAAMTSRDLSAVATAGLAALDALEHSGTSGVGDDAWKAQQLLVVQDAQKPKAQLLLMPAPAVQKLIEAVGPGGNCAAPK